MSTLLYINISIMLFQYQHYYISMSALLYFIFSNMLFQCPNLSRCQGIQYPSWIWKHPDIYCNIIWKNTRQYHPLDAVMIYLHVIFRCWTGHGFPFPRIGPFGSQPHDWKRYPCSTRLGSPIYSIVLLTARIVCAQFILSIFTKTNIKDSRQCMISLFTNKTLLCKSLILVILYDPLRQEFKIVWHNAHFLGCW